ncbi:aspartate aminotransferase family protein [Pseudomonas abietaniphila]
MNELANASQCIPDSNAPSMHPESELSVAIDKASGRYAALNPNSLALFQRAQLCMPGGNTRSALHFEPFPLYVEDSFGARLRDVDGHEYLDALGEFTAGLYGHSDPDIQRAVIQAAGRGASNGAPGESEINLAELICERFPAIEAVRFCNSGTEANLYALTLAKAATNRSKFIAFSGAYHGGVFVFGEGGASVNAPFDWTTCRYNDIEGTTATIQALGPDLCAVIVEPMMSNGGCIPARAQFLRSLREQCDQVGALLIFDEVVTSRMGAGGLQERHGVLPDLTTLGKYIGAGFSFGAFGGRGTLLDLMNPQRGNALPHAGTFNNNVYSMSVGYVGLRNIFTPERADALFQAGERLRARLNERCQESGLPVQFTGCGSTMNIHFHEGEISAPEDLASECKNLKRLFHLDMLDAGIYLARRGQINLSLPMEEEDYDAICTAVKNFLHQRSILIQGS